MVLESRLMRAEAQQRITGDTPCHYSLRLTLRKH
jgi:hypothetical protein